MAKVPPSIAERRQQLGVEGEPIPSDWESIIAACLAKEPAQRPQSAGEIVDQLKLTDRSRVQPRKMVLPVSHKPAAGLSMIRKVGEFQQSTPSVPAPLSEQPQPPPVTPPPATATAAVEANVRLSFRDNAREWCRGRKWPLRLLALIVLAAVLAWHAYDPRHGGLFLFINLGVHQCGHFLFSYFGEFLGVAGGTIVQYLVPLVLLGWCYRQEYFFGAVVSLGWLSTNLFNIATYIADAHLRRLPLTMPFGGDEVFHDWHYLLHQSGLLKAVDIFAITVRTCAILTMLICLGFGGWLVWNMIRLKPEPHGNP